MKALEEDAQERYKRKQEREKVAAGLKEKGNEEFRQGNYEKALDFYTQVCSSLVRVYELQFEKIFLMICIRRLDISACTSMVSDHSLLYSHEEASYLYLSRLDSWPWWLSWMSI